MLQEATKALNSAFNNSFIKKTSQYLHDCVREEVKSSTFRNLKGDKDSRCAIEVCGGKGVIFITGEVTSKSIVDVEKVVNETLNDIGYYKKYKIINNIGIQSNDIALGTNK